jgi:hypothetical protein
MLLRLEPEIERERLDGGIREQRVLKYDGLKRRVKGEGKAQRIVDIIVRRPDHEVCIGRVSLKLSGNDIVRRSTRI